MPHILTCKSRQFEGCCQGTNSDLYLRCHLAGHLRQVGPWLLTWKRLQKWKRASWCVGVSSLSRSLQSVTHDIFPSGSDDVGQGSQA